ncbi:MAG: type 1 glutamine amidotransferase domain-containing protein [Woeseiaceae bacterium]|nr:type 1 glutamine amidotransferase domain-containing protein [Woeseiaceae bacterium]
MSARRVLFVLTGHDRLGDAKDDLAEKTGFHLYEAAKPWVMLRDAGFETVLVTPTGGPAPIDPSSADYDNEDCQRFLADPDVKSALEQSLALHDVDLDDFDAIYFPGGHGTMWDLPTDVSVSAAVISMYERGKVIAAICHGPAALVNAKCPDGRWLVDGKTVSAFTDEEERATGKDTLMPFALSSTLAERGARLKSETNFEACVSVDGQLVTGQNPASAEGVAEAIRQLVEKQSAAA